MKRTTSLPSLSSLSSLSSIKKAARLVSEKRCVSLPNFINEDGNGDDVYDKGVIIFSNNKQPEYIPQRPYSRHSSRDIKEFLTGPPVLHISPYLLDDNAHEDCPDDSRCILIIAAPFSNELEQFKCVHCKKMGDFISHLTFSDKRPPYQCTLCRLYIHHECLISSNIKGCCIAF